MTMKKTKYRIIPKQVDYITQCNYPYMYDITFTDRTMIRLDQIEFNKLCRTIKFSDVRIDTDKVVLYTNDTINTICDRYSELPYGIVTDMSMYLNNSNRVLKLYTILHFNEETVMAGV